MFHRKCEGTSCLFFRDFVVITIFCAAENKRISRPTPTRTSTTRVSSHAAAWRRTSNSPQWIPLRPTRWSRPDWGWAWTTPSPGARGQATFVFYCSTHRRAWRSASRRCLISPRQQKFSLHLWKTIGHNFYRQNKQAFLAIARTGSFTKAASEDDVPSTH